MEIKFLEQAENDLDYWKKSGDITEMNINTILLYEISEHPYTGFGGPEALRYGLQGKWVRRIDAERWIIYTVKESLQTVYIYSLRFHCVKH